MARLRCCVLGRWPTNGARPVETVSGTWLVIGRCSAWAVAVSRKSANGHKAVAMKCKTEVRFIIVVSQIANLRHHKNQVPAADDWRSRFQSLPLLVRARACKCVDQIRALGTAPAGHEVVADHRRILAVAAAGDVVEIAVIARSDADAIQHGIEKPERGLAVCGSLLIRHRDNAGPLRSGDAGASNASEALVLEAKIIILLGLGCHVGIIAPLPRSLIKHVDDARQLLVGGDGKAVFREVTRASLPAGFR